MSRSDSGEIILAQEQSVLCRRGPETEYQGTLVLTNKRLIFATANVEEDLNSNLPASGMRLRYAEVRDLDEIPPNPSNISIPLSGLEVEEGRERLIRKPRLKVKWVEDQKKNAAEFVADIAGSGRKRDLKDWSKVISDLKTGKLKPQLPKAESPPRDSLEGRILYIMGDMQEKGVFEIEKELEEKFQVTDLDPDEVDSACKKLAGEGFLEGFGDSSGDNFYKKSSPLGEDDLSS
jgi:hypothetical protein